MNADIKTIKLKEGWYIKSSFLVKEDGDIVSTEYFTPTNWYPASVPTTVLNALVINGVYPDPRIGLNMYFIPDASDEFNEKHDLLKYSYLPDKRNPWKDPYWYRISFSIPEDCKKRQWLVFNAINYRAEVWLNGKMVADSINMVGAFRRFKYDVTNYIKTGETNYLAVKVHGVDHPGVPGTQLDPLNITRVQKDGERTEIMKDVTFNVAAVGYDCAPDVRDRMMGIWQDVYIECTGDIDIRDSFVETKLPLPETNIAMLSVSAELVNAESIAKRGLLKGTIEEVGIKFEKEVELAPEETKIVIFSPQEFTQLIIDKPSLWWPAGYGDQNLYHMTLNFEIDGDISDKEEVIFGIREITKELYELYGEYGLRVHINGQKIFCRGGYLMVDTLLDSDMMCEERFEQELRYLKEANLNTFCMEDIPNLPDIFFDLCDRYGMMFWNNFHQCHWLKYEDHPLDHDLLEKCDIDIIKRYRNHPSIVAYMCMNEGATLEEQYKRWRRNVIGIDGTRLIIPSGYADFYNHRIWPEWIKQDTPVGANDSQPKSYGWKPHSWYYSMVRDDRSWMFKIESGSASLPPLDSLKRFIPDLGEASEDTIYPLNSTLAHHGANGYYKDYDTAIRRRFGKPESVEDYCWKAHLMTADQHRAMFEAINHLKWDVTSGFLQWKLNSCWPDVQWQLYDYYLRPMVSFYYIKKACEPLHVQLNPISKMVTVINNYLDAKTSLIIKAMVYNFHMELIWENSKIIDVSADCYKDTFKIPYLMGLTPVYFVKLEMYDADNRIVSDNFYWLSSVSDFNDTNCFADLKKLLPVDLDMLYNVETKRQENIVYVKLENPTDKLAFFIHVSVNEGKTGEEVLPVYWDDNYFSLLPGESREVKAVFAAKHLEGKELEIKLDGWNINYSRLVHKFK